MPTSQVELLDNLVGLRSLPDKHFELAIVDPPYGINAANMRMGSSESRKTKGQYPAESTAVRLRKGRLNDGRGKLRNRMLNQSNVDWDNQPPPPEYWLELFRVSKNQIVWGGNYFPLPPTRCIVCWDKKQPWENFSQWEMAWTSFDGPAKLFSYAATGGRNDEKKIHPTQKPVQLYKWLISKFAQPGDKILDTHLGSGSSRIAAWSMGYDFYAYENNPDYYASQEKRFQKFNSQLTIPT